MFLRVSSRAIGVLVVASAAAASFAIVGGPGNIPALDTATSAFQYMGKLSNSQGRGGASPISGSWLVTAKHVAPSVGNTFTNPDGTFTIDQVVNHPTADISLVHVTGTLAHFYTYGSVALGSTVAILGYGKTGPIGATPAAASNAGKNRYIAHNVIDAVYDDVSLTVNGPEFTAYAYDLDDGTHNFIGSASPLVDEGGIADQDSGSGWFYQNGAETRLVAVASGIGDTSAATMFGTSSPYEYGDVGVGADLYEYRDFIFNTTGVRAVPEPASMLALGFGAAAMLRRRRKA